MVAHFPSAPPPPPLPRIYYITLLGGLYILTFGKFIFSLDLITSMQITLKYFLIL